MMANVLIFSLPTQGNHNWETPPVADATLALADLRTLLGSRNTTIHSDVVLRNRLDYLDCFLAIYVGGKGWTEAADYTAAILGQGAGCSRRLRVWGKKFIWDRSALPYHNYVNSRGSSLLDDPNFVEELRVHITDIGTHVSAQAVINFVRKPEVIARYHIVNPITLKTARRWMSKLDFKWWQVPKGTYLDGHERPDVVHHCQNVYLPVLAQREPTFRVWDKDNLTHLIDPASPSPVCHSVLWLYGHDPHGVRVL